MNDKYDMDEEFKKKFAIVLCLKMNSTERIIIYHQKLCRNFDVKIAKELGYSLKFKCKCFTKYALTIRINFS